MAKLAFDKKTSRDMKYNLLCSHSRQTTKLEKLNRLFYFEEVCKKFHCKLRSFILTLCVAFLRWKKERMKKLKLKILKMSTNRFKQLRRDDDSGVNNVFKKIDMSFKCLRSCSSESIEII